MTRTRLLLPITFPDPAIPPSSFAEAVSPMNVVLLGYYDAPSGTATDELRAEREAEVERTVEDVAATLTAAGTDVETRVAFGTDFEAVQERIAEEEACDVIYLPNPIDVLGRLLVPLRDTRNAEQIASFVGSFRKEKLVDLTLLTVVDDENRTEEGRAMLREARAQLVDAGFSKQAIDIEVSVSDDPPFEIGRHAVDFDALVMGETEPTDSERVFGTVHRQVAEQSHHPVFLVRRQP